MTVKRTELGVGGIGMGVEVDQRQPSPAHVVGHASGVGKSDRMVASQHHR